MIWILALTTVVMFIPIAISLVVMPFLTRETVSFGISVSEEMYHSPLLRRMRKQYAWISGILYTLLLTACLFTLLQTDEGGQPYALSSYILMMVIGSAAINLAFYLRMKKVKASFPPNTIKSGKIAVDTRFRSHKITISNRWFALHTAIALTSAALALAYYDEFPATLAMKFGSHGEITHSAAKSLQAVLAPNLTQLALIALFMFLNRMIHKSKQQINPDHPELSARQNAVFRLRWSMFNAVACMMIVLLLSFIQLNMRFQLQSGIVMLVSLLFPSLIIIMAFVLSLTTGQGGRLINRTSPGGGTTAVNDDRYWKLGFVYYNPNDPALFVEKRMGIGWTVNFARPAAWMVTAGILIAVLAAIFFGK